MRSLNQVMLIGNLTKDVELRTTPSGTSVCSFSIATNRNWKTEKGEAKEETEFHSCIAWEKLAEICAQILKKGNKVFIEGRLQTKKFTNAEGVEKEKTEVVVTDMISLANSKEEDRV